MSVLMVRLQTLLPDRTVQTMKKKNGAQSRTRSKPRFAAQLAENRNDRRLKARMSASTCIRMLRVLGKEERKIKEEEEKKEQDCNGFFATCAGFNIF